MITGSVFEDFDNGCMGMHSMDRHIIVVCLVFALTNTCKQIQYKVAISLGKKGKRKGPGEMMMKYTSSVHNK
jgi:hypothetical protein